MAEGHRTYTTKDGTIVPSVTEVIGETLGWNKQALIAWSRREALAGRDPEEQKGRAALRGTAAHARIAAYLKGERFNGDGYTSGVLEESKKMRATFIQWWKKSKGKMLYCEEPLVHEELKFGGTLDLLAVQGDKTWLIDIKTSGNVYPEHAIQLSAYRTLASTNGVAAITLGCCGILHLPAPGEITFHALEAERIEASWEVFRHLLAIHQLRSRVEG